MCYEALCTCMICGEPVPPMFWACKMCAEAYGLLGPYVEWPAWAKGLKELHEQAREAELERLAWEVEIDGEAADI